MNLITILNPSLPFPAMISLLVLLFSSAFNGKGNDNAGLSLGPRVETRASKWNNDNTKIVLWFGSAEEMIAPKRT